MNNMIVPKVIGINQTRHISFQNLIRRVKSVPYKTFSTPPIRDHIYIFTVTNIPFGIGSRDILGAICTLPNVRRDKLFNPMSWVHPTPVLVSY